MGWARILHSLDKRPSEANPADNFFVERVEKPTDNKTSSDYFDRCSVPC
jgi:hypothetical protein